MSRFIGRAKAGLRVREAHAPCGAGSDAVTEQDARKTKTRIGMFLRKYDRRILNGIRLELDRSVKKVAAQKICFIGAESQPSEETSIWEKFGNFASKSASLASLENAKIPRDADASGSFSNANGILGTIGNLFRSHERVEEGNEEKNKKNVTAQV